MIYILTQFKKLIEHHLLQLNQPVPDVTESEAAADAERNYRWNFAVNLLDGVAFWIGFNFAAPSTILPLFLSKLTMNPFAFGAVAVIAQAGWNLPQIFTASYTERIPRKKAMVINAGFFLERLPYWFWPLAALLAPRFPLAAIFVIIGGYAWHAMGAGMVAPAWQDMIARCFPVTRRGRFFGLTTFLGTGVGAFSAAVSSWLFKTYPFPTNFLWAFVLAAVFINLSWVFLALTREPAHPIPPQTHSFDHFGQKLMHILKQDRNFRRFLIARFMMNLGGMGTGFLTIAAIQRWHVRDSTVGLYTIALLTGQACGNLMAGFLADRFGHKLSLEIGAAVATLAFTLAWLAPAPFWFYIAFICLGIGTGASIVSGVMISMEFSDPAQRPTYIGITNTLTGLGGGIAPMIGSGIAQFSYPWLFALSAGVNLLSVILSYFYVNEPRHHKKGDIQEAV